MRVLTLNADDNLANYAKDIANELRKNEVRVTSDFGPEPIKAKIADAETAKIHTMLVIDGRDVGSGKYFRSFTWERKCRREGERRSGGGDFSGD